METHKIKTSYPLKLYLIMESCGFVFPHDFFAARKQIKSGHVKINGEVETNFDREFDYDSEPFTLEVRGHKATITMSN